MEQKNIPPRLELEKLLQLETREIIKKRKIILLHIMIVGKEFEKKRLSKNSR